jgi:hypothetical protein
MRIRGESEVYHGCNGRDEVQRYAGGSLEKMEAPLTKTLDVERSKKQHIYR